MGGGHRRDKRHRALSITMARNGDVAADPMAALVGLPSQDAHGRSMEDIVIDAANGVLDGLPRAKRRDRELVGEAVRRAVRSAVNQAWGKRPICRVQVSVV